MRFSIFAAGVLLGTAASAQEPTLVPATLRGISPAAVTRGQTVTFTLDGLNLAGATRAVFDDPAITGAPQPGPNRNQAKVTATIGPEARPGIHRIFLQTPLGTTGALAFAVGAWPEAAEREPNDSAGEATPVTFPATLTGALGRAGDADCFQFRAEAGQELVFETVASQVRSRLNAVLTLLDGEGRVLAESDGTDGRVDPVLGYRFRGAGAYTLRVRDFENAGGGDVTYRINAGAFPYATGVFPLGVRRGAGEVTLTGWNLGGGERVRVTGDEGGWGAAVTVAATSRGPLLSPVRVAVGEEPEALEAPAGNDTPQRAQPLPVPVTVNGRIDAPSGPDVDHYRFRARKGQPLLLEVQARRLGSPLDSVIEVLDASGNRIERATLRCVAQTVLTLSDRDSASTGLRLLAWNEFAVNDYLYLRGEVVQLIALPRGPDDDARFRNVRGQRVALLETTPTGHAVETPVYKVQVHPPGQEFPPNGMPVFRLYYQNDDGGPLYGKDSRVTFTPPADGEYVVRIADVRGEASERHAYRLTVREPRPDFRLSLSPEHPNVPAGASVPVEVSADRLDGFDGEIEVRLEGLPDGFTATSTTVEAGETTATLLLTAAPDAKTPPDGVPLRVVGRGTAAGRQLARTAQPAGGKVLLTALPKPDLTVTTAQRRIVIRPGEEQWIETAVTRENGFAGRVPLDVKNLPFGVRILDVGLNGVLVTENETKRRFQIVCEPWVKPMRRLVYPTARTETGSAASTEVAGAPIVLEVAPLR